MPTGPGVLDSQQGFTQGFVSAMIDVDTSARDMLGGIRRMLNGVYKYVQFGATRGGQVSAAISPGDPLCYVVGTTPDLDRLTLVDRANSALGAGISMCAVPTTGGPYFGWVQIKGTTQLSGAITGTPAAGSQLTNSGAVAGSLAVRTGAAQTAVATAVDVSVSASPIVQLDYSF